MVAAPGSEAQACTHRLMVHLRGPAQVRLASLLSKELPALMFIRLLTRLGHVMVAPAHVTELAVTPSLQTEVVAPTSCKSKFNLPSSSKISSSFVC